jgi:hypothetical protein
MFLLNAGSSITNFDVLHYPEQPSSYGYPVKVGEIHNREPYYHANQAEAEDVANIVAGDTRSGAYSTQLIRTDAAIGIFVFGRTLIRHDIFSLRDSGQLVIVSSVAGLGCNALQKSPLRFVQADTALSEKLKGVWREFKPLFRTFGSGLYQLTID